MANKSGIKIVKSKKKGEVFVHAVSGKNILVASETFKRRASAFKNIIATAKRYQGILEGTTPVTDENGKRWMHFSGEWNCID